MQKSIALALVIGALIIGAALVYHGQKLVQLSAQLQAMQKQTATLDTNLQRFARDLPNLIGAAGENAGRQAVHGMADEAVQMPLNWLKSTPVKSVTTGLRRFLLPADTRAGTTSQDVPLKSPSLRSEGDGLRRIPSPADAEADTTNSDEIEADGKSRSPAAARTGTPDKDVPLIRFDIPQPLIINIGILSDLKELPAWLRLPRGSQDKPAIPTNPGEEQMDRPTRPADPQ